VRSYAARLTQIERRCAHQHLRMTQQRRLVIRLLAEARDHPDVTQLYRRARATGSDVSLSTIYRNLKQLEHIGAVRRNEFAGGRPRYEVVPTRHHDHLIDLKTGRVIEFRSPEIEQLEMEVALRHGYKIVYHRLDIYAAPIGRSKRHPRNGQ
jgi:Fur family transcriptional regulator, ferric uptake regulator